MKGTAMAPSLLRNAIFVLFGITVTAIPIHVSAQATTTPNSEALALFNTARTLMAEGKYADACPLLEKARSLHAGIGITFNLADCHEHIGLTASAYTGFQETAVAADAAGQPDRAEVARQHAAALLPKLTRLRLVVPAEATATEGFEVRRNDENVRRLFWNKDVPVDPGRHSISATAPGREPWTITVSVEGPGKVVVVDVAMLKPVEGSTAKDQKIGAAREESAGGWMTPRTAAVIMGVSGGIIALGAGVGAGFTVAANGKSSEADALGASFESNSACYRPTAANAETCTELKAALTDQGLYTRTAISSFTVAGIFAVGGGALLLYAASTRDSTNSAVIRATAQLRMVPVVSSTQKGIFLAGTW